MHTAAVRIDPDEGARLRIPAAQSTIQNDPRMLGGQVQTHRQGPPLPAD